MKPLSIMNKWMKVFLLFLISTGFLNPTISKPYCRIQYDTNPETASNDTAGIIKGIFGIPELTISPSPDSMKSFTFSEDQKVMDYDVSPAGINVAVIVEKTEEKNLVEFWQIGNTVLSDSCILPDGFKAKAIAWHPMASVLFIMGEKAGEYQIVRMEKKKNGWNFKNIFSTPSMLRRLVVCPRPFIIPSNPNDKNDYYSYRLFFGMDNGDKSYRIVSITETGKRFYQVIGPAKTIPHVPDDQQEPSKMVADWALPIAFHPGGHELIWEDKSHHFMVARYSAKYWDDFKPMIIPIKTTGTITPTPNGLGFIHWQKDQPGIGIYLQSTNKEEIQIPEYHFIFTPSSVPDGKGIVGLTIQNGHYILNYVSVKVPLADVSNAWMFAKTEEEAGLFQKQFGLFRPHQEDQMYKLYETENYYCNGYDRNAPARPYLVTTDLFWELFGAAYQGLFIVKERDEAIPNFLEFVSEADQFIKNSHKMTSWAPVFSAIIDFLAGNTKNPEVARIQNEKDDVSEITHKDYRYSDLKPRGHYTSSEKMKKYFKAFRYLTTIYQSKKDTLNELNILPKEIKAYAEKWIEAYSGFISPSRYPLVWNTMKSTIPSYCQHKGRGVTMFPLSWGFDNEILNSTVYHEDFPDEIQVRNDTDERLLPSGLDLAAVFGNGFASSLLESDYEKYPPLRKVINNLKGNLKMNSAELSKSENLYNQWINAISIQWADTVNSTNGVMDRRIWRAKRLQTGLASWATLRHATILVNERSDAECGEGGFEEIVMRAPRGYVEPDPFTFSAIAGLFETALHYVSKSIAEKSDMGNTYGKEKHSLYKGIIERLKEAAQDARAFQLMAEKERRGEELTNEENEKILCVAGTGEHLFLVFNSLSNPDYALSTPDPIAKIADVAGNGDISYLMSAVGDPMEWDFIVPFYGGHQIVKGSVYSYYEFSSDQLINDKEWLERQKTEKFLPWIKPFITEKEALGVPVTSY